MKKVCLVAVVLLVGSMIRPASSHAETMTWTITSNYQYQVQVEFYAQSRSAAWPGNGRAYDVNDYAAHTFVLNCVRGEKICYGAWPTGGDRNGQYTTYWGVGQNNRQRCSNCCALCGEEDPVKTLTQ